MLVFQLKRYNWLLNLVFGFRYHFTCSFRFHLVIVVKPLKNDNLSAESLVKISVICCQSHSCDFCLVLILFANCIYILLKLLSGPLELVIVMPELSVGFLPLEQRIELRVWSWEPYPFWAKISEDILIEWWQVLFLDVLDYFNQCNELKLSLLELWILDQCRSFEELDNLVVVAQVLEVILDALWHQIVNGLTDDLVIDIETHHSADLDTSLNLH